MTTKKLDQLDQADQAADLAREAKKLEVFWQELREFGAVLQSNPSKEAAQKYNSAKQALTAQRALVRSMMEA